MRAFLYLWNKEFPVLFSTSETRVGTYATSPGYTWMQAVFVVSKFLVKCAEQDSLSCFLYILVKFIYLFFNPPHKLDFHVGKIQVADKIEIYLFISSGI